MASPIGHSLAGVAVLLSLYPVAERGLPGLLHWGRVRIGLLLGVVVLANLPDFDYFPGLIAGELNRFHRGFTHSLVFCAGVTGICFVLIRLTRTARQVPARRLLWALAWLTFGHIAIDWLAQDMADPRGIPLFWPVSDAVYQFPYPVFPMVNKDEVWHLQNVLAAGVESVVMGTLCFVVAHGRGWRLYSKTEDAHDSTLARDYCR